MSKIINIIIPIFFGVIIWRYFGNNEVVIPTMVDKWWSLKNDNQSIETQIIPFKINKQEEIWNDLVQRLRNARVAPSLKGTYFTYGFNANFMKKLIDYWLNVYNWNNQLNILNQFQHYKTNLEGIDIHFMRSKKSATNDKVIPLLMVHGWPGSIWEFYKILPILSNVENGIAFDVICPSIPGYGYSDAPQVSGFDAADAGRMFHKLMLKLGFNEYYVQGGDWGSLITSLMARAYPKSVKGIHVNMAIPEFGRPNVLIKYLIGNIFPSLIYSQPELLIKKSFFGLFGYLMKESGYMHIQSTKPDTIGFGLNDSPVGLAAYLLEKYSTWTHENNVNCADGCLQQKFTLDELLTQVMIYWTTQTITSSMRFYKEVVTSEEIPLWHKVPITVPSACAAFPQELPGQGEAFFRSSFSNVKLYTNMERGGHFAAFEEPELLAKNIREFVAIVENSNTL